MDVPLVILRGYMNLQKQLQAKLKQVLADNNTTQSAFARELGVSRQEVFIYLNNSCSCDKLVELLNRFGISVELVFSLKTNGDKTCN